MKYNHKRCIYKICLVDHPHIKTNLNFAFISIAVPKFDNISNFYKRNLEEIYTVSFRKIEYFTMSIEPILKSVSKFKFGI